LRCGNIRQICASVATLSATVAPGATCTIQVVFKPTAAGSRTPILELSDTASGSPQKVTLDGTGK